MKVFKIIETEIKMINLLMDFSVIKESHVIDYIFMFIFIFVDYISAIGLKFLLLIYIFGIKIYSNNMCYIHIVHLI